MASSLHTELSRSCLSFALEKPHLPGPQDDGKEACLSFFCKILWAMPLHEAFPEARSASFKTSTRYKATKTGFFNLGTADRWDCP